MFESTITADVIQGKRFKSEDGNYAATTLYCIGGQVNEADSCGTELVKMVGDYELLDQVREYLPGKLEMVTKLVQGGKDKAALHVLSAKPVVGRTSEKK